MPTRDGNHDPTNVHVSLSATFPALDAKQKNTSRRDLDFPPFKDRPAPRVALPGERGGLADALASESCKQNEQ